MAKAVHFFTGSSSRGVPEDYAMRADGQWFTRHRAFNGYTVAWTRWSPCRNSEAISKAMRDGGAWLDYGFTPLRRIEGAPVRLPSASLQ